MQEVSAQVGGEIPGRLGGIGEEEATEDAEDDGWNAFDDEQPVTGIRWKSFDNGRSEDGGRKDCGSLTISMHACRASHPYTRLRMPAARQRHRQVLLP